MKKIFYIYLPFLLFALISCGKSESKSEVKSLFEGNNMSNAAINGTTDKSTGALDTATFGTGCFWCTEAIFEELKGVESVMSGYSGGKKDNPTYDQVCSGTTGHAEVCQITYDPAVISYGDLLEVFWSVHDPTTLNRQGNDVGTQYRSVVFYHNDDQKKLAEEYMKKIDSSKIYKDPLVTEISPYSKFFKAENYHQDYYSSNSSQPYCSFVITPKLDKFKKLFKDKLKK